MDTEVSEEIQHHDPRAFDDDDDDPVVDEWIAVLDEASGNTYYANLATHETSWEIPEGFIDKEDSSREADLVDDDIPVDTNDKNEYDDGERFSDDESEDEKEDDDNSVDEVAGDEKDTVGCEEADIQDEIAEKSVDEKEDDTMTTAAKVEARVDVASAEEDDVDDEETAIDVQTVDKSIDENESEKEDENMSPPSEVEARVDDKESEEVGTADDQEVGTTDDSEKGIVSNSLQNNIESETTLEKDESATPAFMRQLENDTANVSLDDINDFVLLRKGAQSSLDLAPYPHFSSFPKSLSNGDKDGSWGRKVSLSGIAAEFPMIGYVKNHYNLHVVGKFGKTTQIPVEKVISWQTEALTTSIRHLPAELIPIAKQAFRNISGFMGTRSTGKRQNDHCLKLLRNVMAQSEELRDEVYCQLCKQTFKNSSPEGTLRGWQLLNICLATFTPTAELQPYLAAYCEWWSSTSNNEAASRCALRCVTAMQKAKTTPPRCEVPCMEEVESIMENKKINIPIYLLDGSYKDCHVNSWTTSLNLSQMICKSLGIRQPLPFALYEVSSADEERIIDPNERVLDLYAQWQRIRVEQKSKVSRHGDRVQDFRLVYKVALYIDVDADQVEEINMMYIQAVYDVTSGIYSCSMEEYKQLAAIQLQESRGDYQEKHAAFLAENIHEYVPSDVLSGDDSNTVVAAIVEKYKALPTRSRQQAKLAYLKVCESWKAYGSSFHVVQNTRNRSLPHDLILAVNHKGVHVLDPKSKEFLATHLYINAVSWGYSSNGFVIITGNADKEVKHYYKTQQGQIINDMVNAYVNAIVGGISSG